ncbi:MAG: glutamyl-tRNA reductase [Turneriella sp.]
MNGAGLLDHFRAYSLSIGSHALEELSEFPDSRAFYADARLLPAPAPEIRSLLYMATCNRIELYVETEPGTDDAIIEKKLGEISPVFGRILAKAPQVYAGGKMLEHMIAVASGLKSLALGETQIAGQLKRDMAYAQETGWLGAGMMTVIRKALETQKKIRTSTGISENSYSLMSLVENAIVKRGLAPLTGNLILVGASEMSAKVARFALRRSVNRFLLVRKDLSRPMNADLSALMQTYPEKFTLVTLQQLPDEQKQFNAAAIILASSAPHPLFSAQDIQHLQSNSVLQEKAAIVDLSLPANVHPDVSAILGDRLISLDSLKNISDEARADRLSSAAQAEPIIRRAVYQFWLDTLYRDNPRLVQDYLDAKSQQTESEWQRLAQEASLSEKQKRILYDFLKKEQRRALSSHREMILDLMAGTGKMRQA